MTDTIMPCFDHFQIEGNIVGRLLAGYGELEFELCRCVAAVSGDLDAAIRAMFCVRGEEKRINTGDSLVKEKYISSGLGAPYRETIADMHWCRQIRNQYAHCNWYDTSTEGICIYDLESLAKQPVPIEFVTTQRHPISTALLREQEAFFKYVQRRFWHLESAYLRHIGKPASTIYPLSARMTQPPKHN